MPNNDVPTTLALFNERKIDFGLYESTDGAKDIYIELPNLKNCYKKC